MKDLITVRTTILSLLAATLLLAAGCATSSRGVTSEKLAVVEKTIEQARGETARNSAPLELKIAEEKYAAAQSAMKLEKYELANRLADEALADAEYARAKAASAKTVKMADDLADSIKTLKDEIERIPVK